VALVEKEGAGYDFAYYRDAPAGCGSGAALRGSVRRCATDAVDRLGVAETKQHCRRPRKFVHPIIVMAGLDPAIHRKDGRPGFQWKRRFALCPG